MRYVFKYTSRTGPFWPLFSCYLDETPPCRTDDSRLYCYCINNALRSFVGLKCTYCLAYLGSYRLYDISPGTPAGAPSPPPSGNHYRLSSGRGRSGRVSLLCAVFCLAASILFHTSIATPIWPTRSAPSPTYHKFLTAVWHLTTAN